MRHITRSFLPLLAVMPCIASACWEQAAAKHKVPVVWLQSVAEIESSMNPAAVNTGHRHRTGTVDIGLMGVNSDKRMLRNLGVTEQSLLDPCTNIDAGARIFAEKIARYGPTWEAVGAYNASCTTLTVEQCLRARTRYAWRFYRALMRRLESAWPKSSAMPTAAPIYAVGV